MNRRIKTMLFCLITIIMVFSLVGCDETDSTTSNGKKTHTVSKSKNNRRKAKKKNKKKSKKKSNEKYIYDYLTNTMGLSKSAACGVIANIYSESTFRSDIENSSKHYGLCQWGGERRTRLVKYCKERGLNYKSVAGQVRYIHYELKYHYKKVYKKLKSVKNNRSGAYSAGYYFCYYYEIPGNRAKSADRRGGIAMDYYRKY